MKLIVIIPAYNEEASIGQVIQRIPKVNERVSKTRRFINIKKFVNVNLSPQYDFFGRNAGLPFSYLIQGGFYV